MTTTKRLVTIGSLSILVLFGIFVASTPFLREPPVPVVNVTIEPQPPVETTEPISETTSETTEPTSETTNETTGAYQTGERTGEMLSELWTGTKDFGRGLWSTLTEKE
ncbi:hypothetical protein M3672_14885 [Microbacterium enclense]|uniref:hypothetical protein n=1 Tax=Microbacterium enclense TaxID=993073 RepID=UPI002040AC91|nr:hypothetical protein [Microbacterium enclense]MCM3615715.1 hypothetical protein [Microbacterium enclense]